MKTVSFVEKLSQFGLPLVVLVSMFSTTAQAQTAPNEEGHYRTAEGNIVFSVERACKAIPCTMSWGSVKVQLNGGQVNIDNVTAVAAGLNTNVRIVSNAPVTHIYTHDRGINETSSVQKNQAAFESPGEGSPSYNWRDNWTTLSQPKRVVEVKPRYFKVYIKSIMVKAGDISFLQSDLKNASMSFVLTYQTALEQIAEFKQIVAKDSSDARHLNRLEAQLKSLLKVMVDEKGNPLLPITSRRVTEGSRMVMVLSTVLEEILDRYDWNAPLLQNLLLAKETLSKLSREIRTAYEWQDGLAGSGSKALAALSTVLDSELKSMLLIVSVTNDSAIAASFNQLFVANQMLFTRVMASNAGDIAGTELAKSLISKWNSPEFQKILGAMMSAPQTAQAQFQNRVLMAMTAMESIKDYVDPKGDARISVDLPPNVRAKLPTEGQVSSRKMD